VVALTNEHADSDGDIFSHCFKLIGVCPLVGQRTWGGVIGIWPRPRLADGSETTQSEYASWFKDVGYAVEKFGTEPTVVVAHAPEEDAVARPASDRQLAASVRAAMAAIGSGARN
jgi:tricorn protease